MHYVLEGIILEIGSIEKYASGFKKREIIIRNEDDFIQDIKIEFAIGQKVIENEVKKIKSKTKKEKKEPKLDDDLEF